MVLYLEYVLLDNFVMDYLIINLIEKTYKYKINKRNKFISSTIGSLLVLILPYIYKFSFLLLCYRLIIAIIMVLLLKKYKNIKQFFTYLFLFISYTFILGGLISGAISFFKIDCTLSGIIFYTFDFPISIFVLIIWFIYISLRKILKKFSKDKQLCDYLYPIVICMGNERVECVGLYDSGNRIEVDGFGVNIITIDVFTKLFKDINIEKLLLRDISSFNLKDAKYVKINGLQKNGSYLSFIVEKMVVGEDVFNNVRLAVTYKNFAKFDCILSSSLQLK